jgi:O-antigen/teichoic acid export membrane protein
MAPHLKAAANYVGTAVSAIVPLLAIPVYLTTLGPGAWGLISFATMLVALLGILEVGLSQSLTRDLALRLGGFASGARALFRQAEGLYWTISAAGALLLAFGSELIVSEWLHSPPEQQAVAVHCVWFAAWTVLVQLPSAVYRAVLVSAGSFVVLNTTIVTAVLLRHGLGVALLTVWPSVDILLVCHATVALLEAAWRRYFATRTITKADQTQSTQQIQGHPLRAALAMSGAVLIAVFTLQLDRMILSRLAPIEALAYYNIAYALANGVLQAGAPLMLTLAPTFATSSVDEVRMRALCNRLFKWFTVVIALSALAYLGAGDILLHIWLGNAQYEAQVKPILDILLIGSAFNLVYQIGYQRWIALSRTRTIAIVNTLGLVCSLSITPFLVLRFGAAGAAVSWIVINVVGVALSMGFLVPRRPAVEHTPAKL